MAKNKCQQRKICGTLELVEGLLSVADKVKTSGERESLLEAMRGKGPLPESSVEKKRVGRYQGRAVLASLAAELALKFAWEHEPRNQGKPVKWPDGGHHLGKLFCKLGPCLKDKIEDEYLKCSTRKATTTREAFGQYDKPFEQFRYLGEGTYCAPHPFSATDLVTATKCVIKAARPSEG